MDKIISINEKRNKSHHVSKEQYFKYSALSEQTKITYSFAVAEFLTFIKDNGFSITPDAIKAYINHISLTNCISSVNWKVPAIKKYLLNQFSNTKEDLIIRYGIEQAFKYKRVTSRKHILKDDYLTIDEVNEVCNLLTEKMRLIVIALFKTACRISELVNIKLSDVRRDNKKAIIQVIGKGSKARIVYLDLPLLQNILNHFKGKTYLFETKNDNKFHRTAIYKELRRQTLGTIYEGRLHPHLLRHAAAMYLKEERHLTPDQIAKYLSHQDVKTTLQFYFHGTPSAEQLGII